MSPTKKFVFSMGAFLALALLSWNTMSSTPIPVQSRELGIDFSVDFRLVTLAILGLLATRTALSFWRTRVEQRSEAASKEKEKGLVAQGSSALLKADDRGPTAVSEPMLSRLASVSEAGTRWRNPESGSRGISQSANECEPM